MNGPHSEKLTGDGAVHSLPYVAQGPWIQLLADTANSATCLIGGAEVTSTVGFPLAPGAAQGIPPISSDGTLNYYLALNDVLHVIYGG